MFLPLVPNDPAHIYSHIVFSANGSAVDTSIIDGAVVMEGRRLLTLDEDEILQNANEAFLRTRARITG